MLLGRQTLGIRPFDWQIDTADSESEAILKGRDVVLNIGTGSGETVAFTLALSMDKEPIASPILPLSSLMVEQMENTLISTIAVCKDRYQSTRIDGCKKGQDEKGAT